MGDVTKYSPLNYISQITKKGRIVSILALAPLLLVIVSSNTTAVAAASRQLSKLSIVQFSDAAVHKGPMGIKNGMMLRDS